MGTLVGVGWFCSSVSGARDQRVILQCFRFSHSKVQAPVIGALTSSETSAMKLNVESTAFRDRLRG
jgi:hypothetical protein